MEKDHLFAIIFFCCTHVYSLYCIKFMQILVLALVLAFLFKKPPEDDSYKTKIIVSCGHVDLPHGQYRSRRARVLSNRPPPNSVLAADRYQIQLEEKMGVITRDVVLYSFFLAIALVTIYLMSNPNIYNQNVGFSKIFNDHLINVKIAFYVLCVSVYCTRNEFVQIDY